MTLSSIRDLNNEESPKKHERNKKFSSVMLATPYEIKMKIR